MCSVLCTSLFGTFTYMCSVLGSALFGTFTYMDCSSWLIVGFCCGLYRVYRDSVDGFVVGFLFVVGGLLVRIVLAVLLILCTGFVGFVVTMGFTYMGGGEVYVAAFCSNCDGS